MKDAKKYKIRASRRPQRHPLLSGVVHLCDRRGRRPVNISFSEALVDAVGLALPFGLSPADPAYLKVLHLPGRGLWRVFAMYFREEQGTLLWETGERPPWLPLV